jgi:outer membrane protein TolC
MNRLTKKVSFLFSLFFISLVINAQPTQKLSLTQVCQLAVENSKQLKLSRAETEAAQKVTQVTETLRTPSLDASLSASYIGNGTLSDRLFKNWHSVEMPHFGNTFSLQASQVLFAGGAISGNIDKARLQEKVARLQYQQKELDICFLITGYYLDLSKLQNQREVLLQNISRTELLIQQIRSKEKEGMALSNDVTRHELMMQNLKLALIEVDNNTNIINNQLSLTLGLPAGTQIVPDSSALANDRNLINRETLMATAQNNLPELKTVALNKQIAAKEVAIARADYYPHLSLFAANEFNGPILIEVPVINKNFNYWYFGLGVKYNLASLYKNNRKVALANQSQRVAATAEAVAVEQTSITLHNAYTNYTEAAEKVNVYETSLRLARENYGIIYNRYLNGLVLITEMLDASNTQLDAELAVVNARLKLSYCYYKLLRETGAKFY